MSVNGSPTSVSLAGSINENSAAGTLVGLLTGIDPDASEAGAPAQNLTYVLLNDAGGRYKLDPNDSRRLLVATGGPALFDYEASNRNALHTIRVQARDASGAVSRREDLVVTVNQLPETPNAPSGPLAVYFDETGLTAFSANAGTTLATYSLSDPDGPSGLYLEFPGGPHGWFEISNNTVKLKSGLNFDFEWAKNAGYGVADFNADGRADAYMGDIVVTTRDGVTQASATTTTRFYISNVNEVTTLTAPVVSLFQETTGSDSHALRTQAQFTLGDPDQVPPELVILEGNETGVQGRGSTIQVNPGVNWTADWIRAVKGA